MANLFTREEFAIWCQTTIAADDLFATMVMEQATALVVDAAAAPGWELDPTTTPRIAKLIAMRVARRTYLNPDQEISSSVGPISASVLREAAAGMTLTESELEQILNVAPDGDPNNGLWVQRTTRGDIEDELPLVFLPTEEGDYIPYAVEGETSAFGDPVEPLAAYDGPTLSQFNALAAQVTALQTTTSTTDAALDTRLDTAEADITTLETTVAGKADQATVDDLFGDVNAELATKADSADLGVQIRLTQPEAGSGELWADTEA
jgi:hypothetical protein